MQRLVGLFLGAFLAGCAGGPGRDAPAGSSRLDILTAYILALSKRDFEAAAGFLSPGERARLAGPEGAVLPEYRDRLRAMRLTTLMHHPLIRIEQGRITGIYDLMPVLDQAEAGSRASLTAPDTSAPEVHPVPTPPAEDAERERLRRTARTFFKSVDSGRWKEALKLMDRQEREVFLKGDGTLKPAARRRLAAIDTSAWEALALEDGKLTGVVLIIPAEPPGPPESHRN